jgi:hypothetical protein
MGSSTTTVSATPAPTRDAPRAAALVTAVAALEPFFDPRRTWSGAHLEHFAYRAVREAHPELGANEAYLIVVAAARLYAGRERARSRNAGRAV